MVIYDTADKVFTDLLSRSQRPHLILGDLSDLIHIRLLARHHTLSHLGQAPQDRAIGYRVCGCHHLDADYANPRVVLRAIVLPVAEIAHPRAQSWAVVLLDQPAVCFDARRTRDRSPLSRGVEEGDVDVGVALQLVRLVGLGVGEEEIIDAVALLVRAST